MAAGFDELIDFLLAEIALCGTQGADSADFRRFVLRFYSTDSAPVRDNVSDSNSREAGLGRTFYANLWQWVTEHSDIRIIHNEEVVHYSLSEFEEAERSSTGTLDNASSEDTFLSFSTTRKAQPSEPLLGLCTALRQRLSTEGHGAVTPKHVPKSLPSSCSAAAASAVEEGRITAHTVALPRQARRIPTSGDIIVAAFDDPASSTSAPRLFASQNRIWHALTGHGMDFKKVPTMEFALLSLIAANGENGITQPDLTHFSGQDKRSVPHRTDELARKGYIVKNPVQAGKVRTSICHHTKFVSQNHFTNSGTVEDVFQKGTFVASGFMQLLYNEFKNAGVVPTREIRTRLGVPMRTWNKRAVQGALIRLDQTGMIRRFRVRKKKADESWIICIQVLRAPKAEDIENLGFRRQPQGDLDELEVDDGNDDETGNTMDKKLRIPPQWTPERLLGNVIFDFVELGQSIGWDAIVLRDRVLGPFWRRPMESYLTRLTDDWERLQPRHLRHLAIIRDTRNTEEKKFLHYVYRTYGNFQQAVSAGEASWEGVSRPTTKADGPAKQKKNANAGHSLDSWGLRILDHKDFIRFNGTANLSEVRSAIANPRKYGPRWDIALAGEIGHLKSGPPVPKTKARTHKTKGKATPKKANRNEHCSGIETTGDDQDSHGDVAMPRILSRAKSDQPKRKKKDPGLTLTPEQRIALGLKPAGRLSKNAASQILAHRRETGDPESLPDSIVEKPVMHKQAPLLSKEERIALNLPPRGRLGIKKENELREKRGMPKLVGKPKKKRTTTEAPVLNKQQRIALGFKGHGRLHQHFIDALRREQENDIPLEESPAVQAYREFLKSGGTKADDRQDMATARDQTTPIAQEPDSRANSESRQKDTSGTQYTAPKAGQSSVVTLEKRKASGLSPSPPASKKCRRSVSPPEISESSVPLSRVDLDKNSTPPGPSFYLSGDEVTIANATPDHLPHENLEQLDAEDHRQTPTPTQPSDPVRESQKDDSRLEPIARSSLGLYLYPFAKRKVGRGRPRNACLAVFRITRLSEKPWFKTVPIGGADSLQIVSMGPCKSAPTAPTADGAAATSTTVPNTILVSERTARGPDLVLTSGTDVSVPLNTEYLPDRVKHNDHGLDPQFQSEREGHEQPAGLENQESSTDQLQTPSQARSEVALIPSAIPDHDTRAESTDHTSLQALAHADGMEVNEEHLRTHFLSVWNPMNASAQVTQPSYQSPYAPIVQSDSAEATQRTDVARLPMPSLELPLPGTNDSGTNDSGTNDSGTNDSGTNDSGMNDSVTNDSTPRLHGVVGAIAEKEDGSSLGPKKPGARSAGPSIMGSALKFRREIILEIIDRCGGVFPLHGEIWRPFSAIWDRRHGHTSISKPQSSTVQDTLKNMISNPAFNLKRMAFLVKARNATGVKERAIATRSEIAANDPRVMRLAYNMANHALEKSHQFYPEEICDVFEFEKLYIPTTIAPKDETVTFDQLYPELELSIKENKQRRRREKAAQKKAEKEAAKKQNEQVEKALPRRRARAQPQNQDVPRAKRTRLASLNDKNKRYRRAPLQVPILEDVHEVTAGAEVREASPAGSDTSEDIPSINLRPWLVDEIVERGADDEEASGSERAEDEDDENLNSPAPHILDMDMVSLTHPIVSFHSATGTFSTYFNLTAIAEKSPLYAVIKAASIPGGPNKIKKRVRIDDSGTGRASKRVRTSAISSHQELDDEFVYSSTDDSDITSSEDEEDDESEELRPKRKQKKRKQTAAKRRRAKSSTIPTLLERLTGLTGDPNDPIYKEPERLERRRAGSSRPWAERKKRQLNKLKKERSYAETLDHTDHFKKMCLALCLASSMSGENGKVNWIIVEKVYSRDNSFNLSKVKKLWTWMQINMASQLSKLVQTLQTNLLTAYEAGRLPPIEDPEVYDWAGLIRWAMRTCRYPELPLPLYREAIQKFVIDESKYGTLDRTSWFAKNIADTTRTQLQLHLAFVVPLDQTNAQTSRKDDNEVKARSWIRANTATAQTLYNAHAAHEKLKVIGEGILTQVVGGFVQQEHLKMRKIKRQLPGRNYTFTKKFAKTYKRQFELEDFMVATTVKKELDMAFASEDPEKRFYNISRCEEDGSIMAIMSLAADGKVKLVASLPPVNNEFGAPLPRLSKWGFCEGDYIHRSIDRNRLFWDTLVVPTSDYEFGNPLQPLPSPSADWPSLPEPPLPGKHSADALLPIWSSIDGQSVTWPWWYRILNLVLQPLFLQPGATAEDIYSHSPENTIEMFEVQLVLDWLLPLGAVSSTLGGGYQVTSGFWASFGDRLHGVEDDWFGEHVKRKVKTHEKQQWREKYNLRYSAMKAQSMRSADTADKESNPSNDRVPSVGEAMSHHIIQNTRGQYGILQRALLEPTIDGQETAKELHIEVAPSAPTPEATALEDVTTPAKAAQTPPRCPSQAFGEVGALDADIEIEDVAADADAEGEDADVDAEVEDLDAEGELEDVDAEGELDDEMY